MQPLSVQQQDRAIRAEFPAFSLVVDGAWIGIWEGTVRPIAQAYRVLITYFSRRRFPTWTLDNPYVTVIAIDPPLGPDPRGTGERIPHIYGYGRPPAYPALCLYDPAAGEWSPDMPIATTMIPWAIGWLYFYEVWVLTGQWTGGGRHPETRTEPCPKPDALDLESRARQAQSLNAAFHRLGRKIGHFGSYLWMEEEYGASSPPPFLPPSSASISPDDRSPPASISSPALRPAA